MVPPGIASQISDENGQDDALLLLQQQEIKAKLREENARKALLRGGLHGKAITIRGFLDDLSS